MREKWKSSCLFLARRVLGDSLGTFRDGVLGEFTGEDEANGCLDFTRGDGRLLVVGSKLRGLGRDTLEDVYNALELSQAQTEAGIAHR
jgi:hypothetical protein